MDAQEPENSTPNTLLISDLKQPTQTQFLPFFVAADVATTGGLLLSRCCHGGQRWLQPPTVAVT